jgi:hypothetical protein
MADTWYVKTNAQGVVVRVFVDDEEKPAPGDIQLDTKWYWGRAPGIQITHMILGELYTVKDGRLVARNGHPENLDVLRARKKEATERQWISPILGKKRRERLSDARKEVEEHLAACINAEEIKHTRLLGY